MAGGKLVREAETRLRVWLQTFQPGNDRRIVSERALAKELGIGYYAVNRAMSLLVTEGLIRREGNKLYWIEAKQQGTPATFSCDLVVAKRSVHVRTYRKLAQELGIDLKMHLWSSVEEAVAILRQFKPGETESVVFDPPYSQSPYSQPPSIWEPSTTRLVRLGIPVISVCQLAANVSCVLSDKTPGVELILDHLREHGHGEIALCTVLPRSGSPEDVVAQWRWLCLRKGLKKSAGRILQRAGGAQAEDGAVLAGRLATDWKPVSAVVIEATKEYPAQDLLDELARLGMEVPNRLSLAFLTDPMPQVGSVPGVTSLVRDIPLVVETAYLLALRALRKKQEIGLLLQPNIVRVQEKLIPRESTGPGPFGENDPSQLHMSAPHPPGPVPLVNPGGSVNLHFAIHRPYELTGKATDAHFSDLDLGPYVNRPLNFRRGWLGDLPLANFPPGRHSIHGIPFHVLGGSARIHCGAVVFQSLHNTTGSSGRLPVKLEIPVDSPVAAVYFLHGCGYATPMSRFASYSFYHRKKKLGEIPLVALGSASTDCGAETIARANIQDWWPDFPHYDFPHARMVPVAGNETSENLQPHEFLYTLEWINPSPKTPVTRIEITSDPKQPTTLGVLAISILRP